MTQRYEVSQRDEVVWGRVRYREVWVSCGRYEISREISMRYLIHSVALYLKTCLKPRRCVRCHAGAMTCPATFQRHVCRSSMKFRARRGMRYEVGGIVRCGEVV